MLASRVRPSFALDAPVPRDVDLGPPASGSASSADSEEVSQLRRPLGSWTPLGSWATESTTASAPSDHCPREYCHKLVPRNLDLQAQTPNCEKATTLMIRNVPNRYTQADLQEELEQLGCGGTFDFLYAPVDKSSKAGVGYAFVNFLEPAGAEQCATVLQGHAFLRYGKAKEAKVSLAYLQGLEANLAHYGSPTGKSGRAFHRPLVLAPR